VRIVAGRFRGHALAPVPKRGVRPTSDPLREALFNILGTGIAGRPFHDLAAGTGAVGLEAYSRGAEPVVLVERDRAALAAIRRNLELLRIGADDPVRVVAADVGAWLAGGAATDVGGPVGVAFLDPPYGEPKLPRWIDALVASPLLDPESLVLIEHRTGDPAPVGRLRPLWTRRYGDSSLTAAAL
jgi:16S rRNA (guanine966-N2)-methyltransferase